ncbi:MAG: hypothetical protein J7L08_03495 [Candidatus Aenigmarchaeota archaeon]|nr:hypothetical protein [Candidatus Aenigmarchaeota archaeon]
MKDPILSLSEWNFKRKCNKFSWMETRNFKKEIKEIEKKDLSERTPEENMRLGELYVFIGKKENGLVFYKTITDMENAPNEIKAEAYARIGYLNGDRESLSKAIELNEKDEYVYNLKAMELDNKFI